MNGEAQVMGVVNVTPDSFSDGGEYFDAERAIAHGRELATEGADILDIGGESTRPGAEAVGAEEETARVAPVIEALAADGARISVDTSKAREGTATRSREWFHIRSNSRWYFIASSVWPVKNMVFSSNWLSPLNDQLPLPVTRVAVPARETSSRGPSMMANLWCMILLTNRTLTPAASSRPDFELASALPVSFLSSLAVSKTKRTLTPRSTARSSAAWMPASE